MKETEILISGAGSQMGQYFQESLEETLSQKVLAIQGHKELDLRNKDEINEYINDLNVNSKRLIYLNLVSKFIWEEDKIGKKDLTNEPVEPSVLESIFLTSKNMVEALETQIGNKYETLKVCNLGSISKGRMPAWYSFDKAHEMNREYLKRKIESNINMQGVYFFISSVDTAKERLVRPNKPLEEIEKEWMTGEEITQAAIPVILENIYKWQEINIFKPIPGNEDFYEHPERNTKKWRKDMGENSSLLKKKLET
ncbi:MAG: hypothetical protein ABH828_03955 [archaeon]